MFRTFAAALVLVLGMSVVPARAAEPAPGTLVASGALAAAASAAAASKLATDTDWSLPATRLGSQPAKRGALLPMLYLSLAALNAYDAHSTTTGLSHGAVEANPTMRGVVGSPVALLAVKGVATASTVLVAEHLWKTHRKGQAVAVMLISNGLMAAVAAHNAHVVAGLR